MNLDRDTLAAIRDAAWARAAGEHEGPERVRRLRVFRWESLARAADDLILDLSHGETMLPPPEIASPPPAAADEVTTREQDTEADMAEIRRIAAGDGAKLERGEPPEETNRLIEADEAAFRRQYPRR